MTHALEAVQEVFRAPDDQRTYFVWCTCTAETAVGVFHACKRSLDDGHQHSGNLCWALRENEDGTVTFSPSINLVDGRVVPHFHGDKPWTTRLIEGRELR